MYSFEGEFRRRPQQNLSGASKKQERNELLQRAQNERHKREELRRRYSSTILIQAFVRGYLTRQHYKKIQRAEFDQTVQHKSSVGQAPDGQTLALLIQRLLFFYSEEEDASRLVCL